MTGFSLDRQQILDGWKSVEDIENWNLWFDACLERVVDISERVRTSFPWNGTSPTSLGVTLNRREFNVDNPFLPKKILNHKLGIVDPDTPIFDPFKFADKLRSYRGCTVLEKIRELGIDLSHICHVADETGSLSSPQFLCSGPGKFHFADRSKYVQLLRSLLFDPNYKGAADRFRSDSAYKEAKKNTGMSGAGAGKGTDGEPTKDDEVANKRTIAWKLGLSVEAVTPKFIVSAKISLEKKSGSGSN